jgi:hypothetical protein
MPTTRTPNFGLATTIDGAPMATAEWDKLTDGVDRNGSAWDALLGAGVVSGGLVLSSKEVGPSVVLVGGALGVTVANQAITGLANSHTNTVYAVRVDNADPLVATTFNAGVVSFVAADTAPAHSCLLGTIVLDGAGTAGTIINTPAGRRNLVLAAAPQAAISNATGAGDVVAAVNNVLTALRALGLVAS